MPSPYHRVVSLDKILYPTLSLSTQVYKMGSKDMLWAAGWGGGGGRGGGNPMMD